MFRLNTHFAPTLSRGWRRLTGPVVVGLACLSIAGCATTPAPTPPPPAPVTASLQEMMQQAEATTKDGRREAARLQYRDAAKTYPTQKAPWGKLAEDYFDAGDYGNAILAAQEVLQRDAQDVLAQSILAVSGLRVSTTALTALRDQQSGLPKNTRDQAAALTLTLRRTLGEEILVPTDKGPAAPTGKTATGSPRPAPVKPRPPRPAVAAGDQKPTSPAPAASAPAASDPFGKFK